MTSELNESRISSTSRRRLLQTGAVTIGAGLLGLSSDVMANAGPAGRTITGVGQWLGAVPVSPIGGGADGSGAGADGAPALPGAAQNRTFAAEAVPTDPTSYNDWTVGSPGSAIGVQNYTVPGTNVILPIRSGDVATVLMYVATRFNNEVEGLVRGQCWGYDYRPNVNNPSVWSNHASGTAIDLNSLKHPNGVSGTFTAAQKAAVRQILAFCGDVVYWGEDYRGTVDGMHFEIDVPPGSAAMTALVAKISGRYADPQGYVDSVVERADGTVLVTGWAFDADAPATEIQIAIYADNVGISWFPTGVSRNDVNSAFGITGKHGFEVPIKLAPGSHSVAVYAINSGGGSFNPLIGVKTVTVGGNNPLGFLDTATVVDGTVRLTGWAYDADSPATEITLQVNVDNVSAGRFPTGQRRSDVNSFIGAGGNHGFDISLKCAPGTHTIDLYAINIGGGSGNPLIAKQRVQVGSPPKGVIDSVVVDGRTVRIRGWAYDPDEPNTEISVAIYRNNVGVAWFPTGVARPDVNAAYRISGQHGYDISIPNVPAGDQSFSLWGINVGPNGSNPLLAVRSVRVG